MRRRRSRRRGRLRSPLRSGDDNFRRGVSARRRHGGGYRRGRWLLQPDAYIAIFEFELFEVVLAHVGESLLDLFEFGRANFGFRVRLRGRFAFHAFSIQVQISLDLNDIPRRAGEHFGFARVYRNIILDADAADARDVNSRFDGDDVTGLELLLLPSRDARVLVNFDTEAVPGAVGEVAVKLVAGENLPGRSVHFPAGR